MAKHREPVLDETSASTDIIAMLSIIAITYSVGYLFLYREQMMIVFVTLCSCLVLMFGYGLFRYLRMSRQ